MRVRWLRRALTGVGQAPLATLALGGGLGWLLLLSCFGLTFAVVFCGAVLLVTLACAASYRVAATSRLATLVARVRRLVYALAGVWLLSLIGVMSLLFSPPPAPTTAYSHVLILGAGLRNGSELSQILLARLQAALPLLQRQPQVLALVSGGQGPDEDMSEALAMRNWLVAHGIHPSRIIMESRSTSTEENLRFSQRLLPADARVLLLTSNFHLYRSLRLAQQLQLPVVGGHAAPVPASVLINYSVREYFAVVRDWLLQPG